MKHKEQIKQLKDNGAWDWIVQEIDTDLYNRWSSAPDVETREQLMSDRRALGLLMGRIMVICGSETD